MVERVQGRIAFVPLRYGPQVVGGSEALTRELAGGLAARGWEVEVLTSRVVDHIAWSDELPEGESHDHGVTIRRFSSIRRHSPAGQSAQLKIQQGIIPSLDEQWAWIAWRYTTPDLFRYLVRYGSLYDAVIFTPYLFWHTIVGLGVTPRNAVVMPCLHDEPYARLDIVRPVLSEPRSVWFLSEPEHALAHSRGPVTANHPVVGAGVAVPGSYDKPGFIRRFGIERPFVLYAGRREKDKGWDWLLETFAEAVDVGDLDVDLITIGAGEVLTPSRLAGRIRDLGFLSEEDRNDAFASALAYVQPSRMESFSRTVMEAWLAGIPVLAREGSSVVEWHCERSGGGFSFADGSSLAHRIAAMCADSALAAEMAAAGRRYVLDEYSWPVVLDRIEEDLDLIKRHR